MQYITHEQFLERIANLPLPSPLPKTKSAYHFIHKGSHVKMLNGYFVYVKQGGVTYAPELPLKGV